MIAALPPFLPPANPIKVGDLSLRASISDDFQSPGPKQSFLGLEISSWNRKNSKVGEVQMTIAEYEAADVTPNSLAALSDLITGRWRFLMTELRRPVSLNNGTFKLKSLPYFRLTDPRKDTLARGFQLLRREKRFRIAAERWHSAVRRFEAVDSLIDICSSMEAFFGLRDELRLRLAFAAYFSSKQRRRHAFSTTYEMYGLRNEFVHGARIPDVSEAQQKLFVATMADILLSAVRANAVPKAESMNSELLRIHGARPNKSLERTRER